MTKNKKENNFNFPLLNLLLFSSAMIIYMLMETIVFGAGYAILQTAGDISRNSVLILVSDYIKSSMVPIALYFLLIVINEKYRDDEKAQKIITIFSIVTIMLTLIATISLFCIS